MQGGGRLNLYGLEIDCSEQIALKLPKSVDINNNYDKKRGSPLRIIFPSARETQNTPFGIFVASKTPDLYDDKDPFGKFQMCSHGLRGSSQARADHEKNGGLKCGPNQLVQSTIEH